MQQQLPRATTRFGQTRSTSQTRRVARSVASRSTARTLSSSREKCRARNAAAAFTPQSVIQCTKNSARCGYEMCDTPCIVSMWRLPRQSTRQPSQPPHRGQTEPESESFGCRIARRSCSDIPFAASVRPPSSLRPQPLCGIEREISGHNFAPDLSIRGDVGFCQIGKC